MGQQSNAPGPGRDYGTWRRSHWAENLIGIRDENDELVDPVYKDGAIEGVTFTRGRVFILRSRIRPDLPLRPGNRQREGRSCCWCSGTPDPRFPVRLGTDRADLYACTPCAGMYDVPAVEVDA
ncbi:hypothetical protein [Streptomyces sp. NPDC002671]